MNTFRRRHLDNSHGSTPLLCNSQCSNRSRLRFYPLHRFRISHSNGNMHSENRNFTYFSSMESHLLSDDGGGSVRGSLVTHRFSENGFFRGMHEHQERGGVNPRQILVLSNSHQGFEASIFTRFSRSPFQGARSRVEGETIAQGCVKGFLNILPKF